MPNTRAKSAAPKSRSSHESPPRSTSVALELLMSDHRAVEALFKDYEREESQQARRDVAARLCQALKVHTQIEEQLFYPFAREQIDATGLLDEAEIEHASAKNLIAQLDAAREVDEKFDARMKVLKEYILHHVNEEENKLFPKLKGMKPDLDELGQEMHVLKLSLQAGTALEEGADPDSMQRLSAGVPVTAPPR